MTISLNQEEERGFLAYFKNDIRMVHIFASHDRIPPEATDIMSRIFERANRDLSVSAQTPPPKNLTGPKKLNL